MRMRQILVIVVLSLLAIPLPTLAADIWLGANGNFTRAELTDSDLKAKEAFGGGLVAEIGLGKRFSLVLEPNLLIRDTKGSVAARPATSVCFLIGNLLICGTSPGRAGYDFTNTFSYVDVPLLAKFAFREKGFTPYLVAGPSIGFLTSAKYKPSNGAEQDVKDEVKSTEMGICGGLGFDLPLGDTARFFVEGQYVLGLTDALKDDDGHSKFKTIVVKAGFEFAVSRAKN